MIRQAYPATSSRSGSLLALLLLFLAGFGPPLWAQTQGEAIDPREMEQINGEIALLHQALAAGTDENAVSKRLLDAYDRRAELFANGRDPEGEVQAEIVARRLLGRSPDDPVALFFAARAAWREKKIDEARQLIARSDRETMPARLRARVELLDGRLAFLSRDFDGAVSRASHAASSPERGVVADARRLLQTAKFFREEQARLNKRIRQRRDDLEAHLGLAQLYLRPELAIHSSQVRQTLQELETQLENWPEYIPAQLFLARAVLEHGGEIERAERICRRALARTRADAERKDAATLLNEILMKKITGKGEK